MGETESARMVRSVPSLRSPLFVPALCCAFGCWLGGSFALSVFGLGVGLGALLAAWFILRSWSPRGATLAFYLICLGGAALHSRLPQAYLAPDDLRLLPESKFVNPAWEGTIGGSSEFRPSKRDPAKGRARFILKVDRWKQTDDWAPARGSIEVSVNETTDRWRSGERVRVEGPLAVPPGALGPGLFDPRAYLALRGTYYELPVSDSNVSLLQPPSPLADAFANGAAAARQWGSRELELGVEDDPLPAHLVASFILGRRDLVPPLVLSYFRATGTYHLFAVSAVNMGVLFGLALAALRLTGLIRWRWGWLLAPLLFFYVLASGGHPSVIRALISSGVIVAAWTLGRPMAPLHLWSLTVLILLALFPGAALDLGFQFSFGVVLALILLAPPLADWIERPLALDPLIAVRYAPPLLRFRSTANRWVGGLLAGCLAAWIGSMVLEAAYFHQLCLASVAANLVAIPMVGLIFTIGLCALLGGLIHPGLAILCNNANWFFAKILLVVVMFLAHLPGASVYFPPAGWLGDDREPQFLVLPADYGTTLLIRHRGHAWLVNPSDEDGLFYTIEPARKYLGVNRLDRMIVGQWTSADGSAAALLPQVLPTAAIQAPPPPEKRVPKWADPLIKALPPGAAWQAGQQIALDPELTVTVLSPDPANPAKTAPDRALVLLFDYHGARFLYAGHVSFGIEQEILQRIPDLTAGVVTEGHGTETNLTPEWLGALDPGDLILIGEHRKASSQEEPGATPPKEDHPRRWHPAEAGAVVAVLHRDGSTTTRLWNGPEGFSSPAPVPVSPQPDPAPAPVNGGAGASPDPAPDPNPPS